MTFRILLTIPNFKTAGSQHVLLSLYHNYKNAGHEVFVLTEDPNGYFPDSIDKSDQIVIVKSTYSNLTEGLRYCNRLSSELNRLKIDVVHSWDYRSELWEAITCRWTGTTYVYTKKNNSWSKKWMVKSLLSQHIAYDQPEMAKRFFKHPLLNKKASFIPHGVDTGIFLYDPSVKKPSCIIGCIGNIVTNKNQLLILKALHLCNLDIKCEFYGNADVNYLDELKSYIQEKRLEGKVEFKGFVNNDHLPSVINKFDILILASFNEGLPVTVLEAISCGTYCVASDSGGGTRYIFDLCKTGSLFNPTDEIQLSELITEYYRDSWSATQKSIDAISIVKEHFSANSEAQKYLNLFKKIVK